MHGSIPSVPGLQGRIVTTLCKPSRGHAPALAHTSTCMNMAKSGTNPGTTLSLNPPPSTINPKPSPVI